MERKTQFHFVALDVIFQKYYRLKISTTYLEFTRLIDRPKHFSQFLQ